jgi:glucans biosynthesis protein
MEQRYDLDVVVDASRGTIENPYALKVVGTDRWRAVFDLLADGDEPVDLRCYLRLDGRALTETWIYQYFPGNYGVQV